MTRIALINGSLRKESLNSQLAEHIEKSLSRHATVTQLFYEDLPPMNPDLIWPIPEAVGRVNAEVSASDGLWFVCPDYHKSYPGHVKSLIDWLASPYEVAGQESSATVIQGKKVTISGVVGKSSGEGMLPKLSELLEVVGADIMAYPIMTVPRASRDGAATMLTFTDYDESALEEQVDAFYAYVVGTPDMPTVHDTSSVPSEPSEGGVFGRAEEIGGCSSEGCSVHHRA